MKLDVLIKRTGEVKLYEEIPDEDLWEDGEITEAHSLAIKMYERVVVEGDWKLVRRIDEA